jgi:hypothetical protein
LSYFFLFFYLREKEEEERKIFEEKENKKRLKEYLDMQVEEKRRMNEFEKNLDNEQARIWKMDTNKFNSMENEINTKVNIILILFYIILFF